MGEIQNVKVYHMEQQKMDHTFKLYFSKGFTILAVLL